MTGTSANQKAKSSPLDLDKNAMWTEKYRPKTLEDVAAHKEILSTSKPRCSESLRTENVQYGKAAFVLSENETLSTV